MTAYSPVLLSQAGYSALTQNGLAGGLNTIGIVGTIISAQIVDRLGRRTCLVGGAAGLFAVNLIAGSLYEAARSQAEKAEQFAPAAVAMLFLFNLCYAATWGTVAFLVPTEIWSSDMRAQGNGFGITGWAIGVGWTTLVNPIMFETLKNRTYFLFAALNLIWMPIAWLCECWNAGKDTQTADKCPSLSRNSGQVVGIDRRLVLDIVRIQLEDGTAVQGTRRYTGGDGTVSGIAEGGREGAIVAEERNGGGVETTEGKRGFAVGRPRWGWWGMVRQ